MQTNLFFLCGPHGSGKTTLESELKRTNSRISVPELSSRSPKFEAEPGYRQILKICERAIEGYEYLQHAKKNPDRIILGNRCLYDVLAYNWVYFERGWISSEVRERYDSHALDFFREENAEPLAIVLNPGFEVVKKHLEKRWQSKGKKWREEDLEYARLACQAYERFRDNPRIFYIDHEIDLASGLDIVSVNEWINSFNRARAA